MTWIRCSDRMPMGEACEVRLDEFIEGYRCATVETLRRRFGSDPNWIDRTEWRPLETAPLHDEGEPATWHDETRGVDEEPAKNAVAWNGSEWVTCSEEEAKRMAEDVARAEARADGKMDVTFSARLPVYEAEVTYEATELHDLFERAEAEEETLRAALRRFGFTEQARMLQEECGELIAAINRWFRDRNDAFEAMVEEMADVEILIDQMRLVYGAEIDEARARKLARLKERLVDVPRSDVWPRPQEELKR